ncbi:hypothetical protein [Kluyvera sichuanensis]|uniref:hypothetical protein n=1 Tax=Kluyvera sichuanensis TaxID=2725494 RepID=UPI0039F64A2E
MRLRLCLKQGAKTVIKRAENEAATSEDGSPGLFANDGDNVICCPSAAFFQEIQ